MSTHRLTIEGTYCRDWGIKEALREILQNAIDTKTPVSVTAVEPTLWSVKDSGPGLHLSDFLLGRTSKSGDSTTIGQFGEGAPLGALVFVREGRKLEILSAGTRYKFTMEYDEKWKASLLTIVDSDFPAAQGTEVFVECSRREMEAAMELFLYFNPKPTLESTKDYDILEGSGDVYSNGLHISKGKWTLSYNLKEHKELVNRDRNAIKGGAIESAISSVLGKTKNAQVIDRLLRRFFQGKHVAEFDSSVYPDSYQTWKDALARTKGSKICLASNSEETNDLASDLGYEVLRNLPWGLEGLFARIGVPKASELVAKIEPKPLTEEQLELDELRYWHKAREIALTAAQFLPKLVPLITEAVVFEDRNQALEGIVLPGDTVGVNRTVLRNLPYFIAGVILHEAIHILSDQRDKTRGFENQLTDLIGLLAAKLHEQK